MYRWPMISPLRELARLMVDKGLEWVPITRSHEFLGIASALTVMAEVHKSLHPLTGLPWTDSLRDGSWRGFPSALRPASFLSTWTSSARSTADTGTLQGPPLLEVVQAMACTADPQDSLICRYGGDG